jgi:hypothetical protein
MRSSLAPVLLALGALSGCVTEGGRAGIVDESPKGPVEYAQDSIRQRLDRMRYLHGKELLAEMERIIATRELAIDPVIQALDGADPRMQANLLYMLGYIPASECRAAVVPYLKSQDESVRYEAAAALIQLGDMSAAPVLITLMESEDKRLRFKAFESLRPPPTRNSVSSSTPPRRTAARPSGSGGTGGTSGGRP